ncbi:MAG TPA: choice-of-anchor tandem repeat GloVer-containing protein [Terriglobales bacterium]
MNYIRRQTIRRQNRTSSRARFALTLIAVIVGIAASAIPSLAQIPSPTLAYTFQGGTTDVWNPWGPMAQGRDGNLYGTGQSRGANGTGGVFKITPANVETLVASFPGTWVNCGYSGLTLAMDGNFYGTCQLSGANNAGFIYRVTPAGVLTDIYDFLNRTTDACCPLGALVLGASGDLYGTTGDLSSSSPQVAFRISTAGVYKTLYTFADGNSLPSVLTAGGDGNFYGTEADADGYGNVGGVFHIAAAGTFKLLYGFDNTVNVSGPSTGVVRDSNGKLYGTTAFPSGTGNGALYDVTTGGKLTDIYNFPATLNFDEAANNMMQASNGNLYGASYNGGTGASGGLYELTSANAFSSYSFATDSNMGSGPRAPLMQNTNGIIYGSNSSGNAVTGGALFELNIGAAPFISLVTPVHSGEEGAQVQILGQGFSSSSVVKFGGIEATTTTLTGSTFILATVPTGALTGDVTVTTGSTVLSTVSSYSITPTLKSFEPPSGPVGTEVTITGTGLTQATKVTFDNVSATFTVNSDSQITATVPTAAATGKIKVTTKGGSATSSKSFTVN